MFEKSETVLRDNSALVYGMNKLDTILIMLGTREGKGRESTNLYCKHNLGNEDEWRAISICISMALYRRNNNNSTWWPIAVLFWYRLIHASECTVRAR